jgi:hypothetical protein
MCNQRAGRRPLGAEADEDHHPESKFAVSDLTGPITVRKLTIPEYN